MKSNQTTKNKDRKSNIKYQNIVGGVVICFVIVFGVNSIVNLIQYVNHKRSYFEANYPQGVYSNSNNLGQTQNNSNQQSDETKTATQGNLDKLKFKISQKPVLSDKKFDLFTPVDGFNEFIQRGYKLGIVNGDRIELESGITTWFSEGDLYVIGYGEGADLETSQVVFVIYNESSTYLLGYSGDLSLETRNDVERVKAFDFLNHLYPKTFDSLIKSLGQNEKSGLRTYKGYYFYDSRYRLITADSMVNSKLMDSVGETDIYFGQTPSGRRIYFTKSNDNMVIELFLRAEFFYHTRDSYVIPSNIVRSQEIYEVGEKDLVMSLGMGFVPAIKWNDGKANDASYIDNSDFEYCSVGNQIVSSDLSKLVVVGKDNNGGLVYAPKDINDTRIKNAYGKYQESFNSYSETDQKEIRTINSINEFYNAKPLIFWVNQYGHLMILSNAELIFESLGQRGVFCLN